MKTKEKEADMWHQKYDNANTMLNTEMSKNSELERESGSEKVKKKEFKKFHDNLVAQMKEEIDTVERRF